MRNLSLYSILQFLVIFSASGQIFPTTAALYTHKHTHTHTQSYIQNTMDRKSKQRVTKIFLSLLTAMTDIREFHLSRSLQTI
jgi:hypothetical protein